MYFCLSILDLHWLLGVINHLGVDGVGATDKEVLALLKREDVVSNSAVWAQSLFFRCRSSEKYVQYLTVPKYVLCVYFKLNAENLSIFCESKLEPLF